MYLSKKEVDLLQASKSKSKQNKPPYPMFVFFFNVTIVLRLMPAMLRYRTKLGTTLSYSNCIVYWLNPFETSRKKQGESGEVGSHVKKSVQWGGRTTLPKSYGISCAYGKQMELSTEARSS